MTRKARQTGEKRQGKRRRLGWVIVISLLAGGIAGFLTFNAKPKLPELNLSEIDPAIVRSIKEAEEKVWQSPRSGDAWGTLATILAVHDFATPADLCFQKAERFSPREPKWPYLRGLMESG